MFFSVLLYTKFETLKKLFSLSEQLLQLTKLLFNDQSMYKVSIGKNDTVRYIVTEREL